RRNALALGQRSRSMGFGRLVFAAAIQAAVFALVLIASRHLGKRLEADGTLLLGVFRLLAAQPNGLDDRLLLLLLDGECDLDAFLQLLRLQAILQVLAFPVKHLDVLGGLHGAVLAVHPDDQDALLRIDFLDRASDFEGEKTPGQNDEGATSAKPPTMHE